MYAIRHARRKTIHEHQFQSPLSTHLFVERFLEDLKLSFEREKKRAPAPQSIGPHGWLPPPQGMVKINVDTAVRKVSGRISMAGVARSDTGLFMRESSVMLPGKCDPETLEALVEGVCAWISRNFCYTNTQDLFYVVAIKGFDRYELTE